MCTSPWLDRTQLSGPALGRRGRRTGDSPEYEDGLARNMSVRWRGVAWLCVWMAEEHAV